MSPSSTQTASLSFEGHTSAFSNQWGASDWERAMAGLRGAFPVQGIDFVPSDPDQWIDFVPADPDQGIDFVPPDPDQGIDFVPAEQRRAFAPPSMPIRA